jgi:hypothetical protein
MGRLLTKPSTFHNRCNDLRRLLKIETRWFSVRVHNWVSGDPVQYQHMHPWPFLTVVLTGGYDDVGDGRPTDFVRGPCIRYRPMSWRHSVINVIPGTWTIVITGKIMRKWRFFIDNKEVDEKTWGLRKCD